MSETMTLEDLAPLKGEPPARVYVKKVDAQGRAYATGKRKDAVARVWVKPGAGKITVNGKEHAAYFARPVLQMILKQPLVTAKREGQFDIGRVVFDQQNIGVRLFPSAILSTHSS